MDRRNTKDCYAVRFEVPYSFPIHNKKECEKFVDSQLKLHLHYSCHKISIRNSKGEFIVKNRKGRLGFFEREHNGVSTG